MRNLLGVPRSGPLDPTQIAERDRLTRESEGAGRVVRKDKSDLSKTFFQ